MTDQLLMTHLVLLTLTIASGLVCVGVEMGKDRGEFALPIFALTLAFAIWQIAITARLFGCLS